MGVMRVSLPASVVGADECEGRGGDAEYRVSCRGEAETTVKLHLSLYRVAFICYIPLRFE